MINDLVSSKEYKNLVSKQLKDLLLLLMSNNKPFELITNISWVTFTPDIPEEITTNFTKYTLFSIANYTLESLELHDKYLTFEAGFGQNNFGSICKIPYLAIFKASIDSSILFINQIATVDKYSMSEDEEKIQVEKSRKAFKLIK